MTVKKLISRKNAAAMLDVTTRQMIRVEKSNNLTVIKLVNSKQGNVYYKVAEIELLINGDLKNSNVAS